MLSSKITDNNNMCTVSPAAAEMIGAFKAKQIKIQAYSVRKKALRTP